MGHGSHRQRGLEKRAPHQAGGAPENTAETGKKIKGQKEGHQVPKTLSGFLGPASRKPEAFDSSPSIVPFAADTEN